MTLLFGRQLHFNLCSEMTLVLPAGDMLKKIQSDLNLEEGREQEDLSKLKEWLACQPHLPQIDGIHQTS